jgi:hypothetical protein
MLFGRGAPRRVGVLAAFVVLIVAGCGGATRVTTTGSTAGARARPAAMVAPGDLRTRFEALLGEHSILLIRLMRGEVSDQPDFAEAANAAVVQNTERLARLVAASLGAAAGQAFKKVWITHIDELDDYAHALASNDKAAAKTALDGLNNYRAAYGAFVHKATKGAISASAAAENLREHLGHLTQQINAYVAKNYVRAYELERVAYAHMFPTARALAGGLSGRPPGELPVTVDPTLQLRSSLGLLLGEHFELAVDAMRSGSRDARDFNAAKHALDENTRDFATAFDGIFGPAPARAFDKVWADHIDTLFAYTVAATDNNNRARAKQRSSMKRSEHDLAVTFNALTGGRVPVATLAAVFAMHDTDLEQQIDAYVGRNYQRAHAASDRGYEHMFATAAVLAPAIERATAPALPKGGVQTGGGGMARDVANGR